MAGSPTPHAASAVVVTLQGKINYITQRQLCTPAWPTAWMGQGVFRLHKYGQETARETFGGHVRNLARSSHQRAHTRHLFARRRERKTTRRAADPAEEVGEPGARTAARSSAMNEIRDRAHPLLSRDGHRNAVTI